MKKQIQNLEEVNLHISTTANRDSKGNKIGYFATVNLEAYSPTFKTPEEADNFGKAIEKKLKDCGIK